MQYDFPAMFYSDEKAVAFHFYDREDWFSFGDNVDEAITAAEEILNDSLLELEREGKEIPAPTPLDKVVVKQLHLVKMIKQSRRVQLRSYLCTVQGGIQSAPL